VSASHDPRGARSAADRSRTGCAPRSLGEFIGQQHLLGSGKPLSASIASGQLHSLILWGPAGHRQDHARAAHCPGLQRPVHRSLGRHGRSEGYPRRGGGGTHGAHPGRSTHAAVPGRGAPFQQGAAGYVPAVSGGRHAHFRGRDYRESVLRSNQRPAVARARVYVLRPLSVEDLTTLLQAALRDAERGLGGQQLQAEKCGSGSHRARAADGDARRALNMLELAAGLVEAGGAAHLLTVCRGAGSGLRRAAPLRQGR